MKVAAAMPPMMILAACATASVPDVPGCQDGPCVGIGETQDLGTVAVTPLAVLEDSRCPAEVECVWAGRVRINAQVTMGHETTEAELTSYEPLAIDGGTLTLAEVAPGASNQWPDLADADYAFRFTFTD